jgi:hypothetical protein
MTPTPAEGLDNLGILATGPAKYAARHVQPSQEIATFDGDPGLRPRSLGNETQAQIEYMATRPIGAMLICGPADPRWSQEAEAEARRRGWMTSRWPRHDGTPHPTAFDLWWPLDTV